MRLHRIVAASAAALGMCSIAYAGGPVAPMGDLPFSQQLTPIPVHSSCHQNIRTHGGSYPPHYHNQGNCAVVYADQGGGYNDDCHHHVLRHWLPGYGTVWHRHTGSCNVQLYDHPGGPTPGYGGCITVGPATICP